MSDTPDSADAIARLSETEVWLAGACIKANRLKLEEGRRLATLPVAHRLSEDAVLFQFACAGPANPGDLQHCANTADGMLRQAMWAQYCVARGCLLSQRHVDAKIAFDKALALANVVVPAHSFEESIRQEFARLSL
eukprot:TRINITY_DN3413_c0_g2_i1.p1 TRINITY_DN3413_c0_g2~~TRINITY_DN3413_c0_g2_i1.p1  ORF type:complete len:158 (-),score=28.17 TRINITY_DN3413_c0_g2_i1:85-492(-)